MRLVKALSIVLVALASAATVQSQTPEPEAARIRVTLDRALYFLGPDGSDVIVEPGSYRVELTSQTQLGLISRGGKEILVIPAVATTHDEALATATALVLPPDERDEAFHLVLLLPDGSGLDAAGSVTQVRTRAAAQPLDPARIRAASVAGGTFSPPPVPSSTTSTARPTGIQQPTGVVAPEITPLAPPPPPSFTSPAPTTANCNTIPTIRPYFRIDCNGPECQQKVQTLLDGLKTPHALIRLWDGVDMDLSNLAGIPIACGVEVIGTRTPQNPGPRLFTKTRPIPLFDIQGHNVKLLGFRLQGPDYKSMEGDDKLQKGIQINSKTGIEIGNMELSGWSGSAISIRDEANAMGFDERGLMRGLVKVHDNFIHHNQHDGKFGYGVALGYGAYALIERNVFDYNRHAITGDGRNGTGFYAHRNLVLKGGGRHDWYMSTHQFDMHGQESCNLGHYNCGRAGEWIEVSYNAFQYRNDNAFKLRGTPSVVALVKHNVFAHGSVGDAAVQTETGMKREDNRAGIDTFGKYGVCDFDGDGRDDLFLATGVTWWYSHSAKEPWVYLNSDSRLLQELGLGYFDDDKKCDVVAVHGQNLVISRGGTSPWETLGSYGVPIDQLRFHDFNGDGITDVFRRSPDEKWSVVFSPGQPIWTLVGSSFPLAISPGLPNTRPWTQFNSSPLPLSTLKFGDFNGDGITDILSTSNGQWLVSWSGKANWERLNNTLTKNLEGMQSCQMVKNMNEQCFVIADVDGNGKDDILLYWGTDATDALGTGQPGFWQVSWDGRSDWKKIFGPVSGGSLGFAGRFDTSPGADLLVAESARLVPDNVSRISYISSAGKGPFVQHSRFAY